MEVCFGGFFGLSLVVSGLPFSCLECRRQFLRNQQYISIGAVESPQLQLDCHFNHGDYVHHHLLIVLVDWLRFFGSLAGCRLLWEHIRKDNSGIAHGNW